MAIFLIVILAALGGYMVSVSTSQQKGHALDMIGARALMAASAGLEWGVYQVVKEATYCSSTSAAAPTAHTLPSSTLSGLGEFVVEVRCHRQTFVEGSETYSVYRLSAVACNAAACTTPSGENYVERRLTSTVTR